MFTIDNDKPQALGALVKFPTPPKAPTVQHLKPGLTLVDGKMAFDPALSANPPEPATTTRQRGENMHEIHLRVQAEHTTMLDLGRDDTTTFYTVAGSGGMCIAAPAGFTLTTLDAFREAIRQEIEAAMLLRY